jgi:hypothetical protein
VAEAEKQWLLVEIGSLRHQMSEEDALLREAQSQLSDAEPILSENQTIRWVQQDNG